MQYYIIGVLAQPSHLGWREVWEVKQTAEFILLVLVLHCCRYKPKAFPKTPICKHPDGKLRCNELSMQDVRRIHQKFHKQPDRVWQNNFILQHISVSSVRRTFNVDNPRRKISTQFVLPKRRGNVVENIRVCRAAFVNILHVGRDRLHRLCQNILKMKQRPLKREEATGEHTSTKRKKKV